MSFVIGGTSLYQMYILEAQKIYLTEIKDTRPADVYFPAFDKNGYEMQTIYKGLENDLDFSINEYTLKRGIKN